MKLLIKKSVTFTLPLIFIFLGLEFIFDDSSLIQTSAVYKKVNDFLQVKEEVMILVLGNSHGDNAISEYYHPQIFNLANQGQDLKYDLFLLNLIDDIKNVKIIILTFSYFSFEYSEDKIWPYRVKDYLDARQLKPSKRIYELKDWLYDNSDLINYNLSFNKIIFWQIKRHFTSDLAPKKITNNRMILSNTNTNELNFDFTKDAMNRAIRTQSSYFNTSFQNISKYLDEIIIKCRKSNKMILAAVPPFHNSYNSNFPKEKLNSFQKRMNFISEYYDIPVLNYANDSHFAEEDSFFVNSDHLNKIGAEKFTKILINDIIQLSKTPNRCIETLNLTF